MMRRFEYAEDRKVLENWLKAPTCSKRVRVYSWLTSYQAYADDHIEVWIEKRGRAYAQHVPICQLQCHDWRKVMAHVFRDLRLAIKLWEAR
jgi:hypothetical protein